MSTAFRKNRDGKSRTGRDRHRCPVCGQVFACPTDVGATAIDEVDCAELYAPAVPSGHATPFACIAPPQSLPRVSPTELPGFVFHPARCDSRFAPCFAMGYAEISCRTAPGGALSPWGKAAAHPVRLVRCSHDSTRNAYRVISCGRVAERSKATDCKSVGLRPTKVRILPRPPPSGALGAHLLTTRLSKDRRRWQRKSSTARSRT